MRLAFSPVTFHIQSNEQIARRLAYFCGRESTLSVTVWLQHLLMYLFINSSYCTLGELARCRFFWLILASQTNQEQ
jgi:hypothetical protein